MSYINFDYKLDPQWKDFTSIIAKPAGETENAKIVVLTSNQHFGTLVIDKLYRIDPILDITIYVDTQESWYMLGTQTPPFLAHEQGHYDIAAIGIRELYKGLMALRGKDIHDLDKKIKDLNALYKIRMDNKSKSYDDQTKHGDEKSVQMIWEAKIHSTKLNPVGVLHELQ